MTRTKRYWGGWAAAVAGATVLSLVLIATSPAVAAGADDNPSCGGKGSLKPQAPLPIASPDAAPEFFCGKMEITMPDVWAGNDIMPKWIVQNKGKGDLSIQIKGG